MPQPFAPLKDASRALLGPALRRLCALILWGSLCLLPAVLQAAKPQITATLEPGEIRPGSDTSYTLTFENGPPDEIVELQLPPQLLVPSGQVPSLQSQLSITNGAQKQTYSLTWEISSVDPGTYTIPSQEFHVGGVPFRSNEVKLVVSKETNKAVSLYDPLMTIQVEKTEMYVGELVPVTVNLYIHHATMLRRLGLIEMPKDSFAVQRFPLQGEETPILMGGQRYRDMAFRSTVAGLKPGRNKLGPASMEIQVDVPVGGASRNPSPFFAQPTEPRKFTPQCNEIELNVLPLPEEGKPANFGGAVGDFQMAGSADPTTLAVGDPVAVDITISGVGNFDAITAPTMAHPEDWKIYPARKYSPDGPMSANTPPLNGSELATQRLSFTQVILPKKVMTEIPPFEFSYFSPTQKKYITIATEAIPLKMSGAPERPSESAGQAVSQAAPAAEEPEKVSSPRANITDILTVTPNTATFVPTNRGLWGNESFRRLNFALGGVLALMILGRIGGSALGAYRLHRATPERTLWRQLNQRSLTRAQFYTLAANYVENHQVKPAPAEAVQSILERHWSLNFGHRATIEAQAVIPGDERSQVLSVLKTLR